ncbi:MAG: zinc-ribbon domain-containing protein [Candidatus Brocadiae bacterium]|nr:zinc-ribbon domain-containing protein [Candidatus Brocadiia bacterium]
MALISCTECGKEVSDKAASCPNCGVPILGASAVSLNPQSHAKVTRTGAKWEGIGFILIIVGMIMAMASQGGFGGLLIAVGFVVFIIGRFK